MSKERERDVFCVRKRRSSHIFGSKYRPSPPPILEEGHSRDQQSIFPCCWQQKPAKCFVILLPEIDNVDMFEKIFKRQGQQSKFQLQVWRLKTPDFSCWRIIANYGGGLEWLAKVDFSLQIEIQKTVFSAFESSPGNRRYEQNWISSSKSVVQQTNTRFNNACTWTVDGCLILK